MPQLSHLTGLFVVGLLKIAPNSIRRPVAVNVTGAPDIGALVNTSYQGLGRRTVAWSSNRNVHGVEHPRVRMKRLEDHPWTVSCHSTWTLSIAQSLVANVASTVRVFEPAAGQYQPGLGDSDQA